MTTIKKDHSIGEGTGAASGAIAGAAVGALGGPAGMAVGAAVGAIAGAKVGGSLAEMVNPTTYAEHFESNYQSAPYYPSDKNWSDYSPAYQYGYDHYRSNPGRRFEAVENSLERGWENAKAESRLAWGEAREAVRDGWHYIERAMPGDADGDGR